MVDVCYKTDIGNIRTVNEDSLLVKKFDDAYVLAIADGIGGHAGGEFASKTALREIEDYFERQLEKENLKDMMEGAIKTANEKIYGIQKDYPEYVDMGTTLVMAVVSENKAKIANIGDSRAYCVGEKIERITKDHSLVRELLDKKVITEEEAFTHPQRNILARALGTGPEVNADFYDFEIDWPYLLLCSDGLSDSLKEEEINDIILESKSLEGACDDLIDSAKENGGKDNITVILAKLR